MGNVSDWQDAPTVHNGLSWLVTGFKEGHAEGLFYGPQSYWKVLASTLHPELEGEDRRLFTEGFLKGVERGIEERRRALKWAQRDSRRL